MRNIQTFIKSNLSSFIEGYAVFGMYASTKYCDDQLKAAGSLVYHPQEYSDFNEGSIWSQRKGFGESDLKKAGIEKHFLGIIKENAKHEHISNISMSVLGAGTGFLLAVNLMASVAYPFLYNLKDILNNKGGVDYAIASSLLFIGTNIASGLYERNFKKSKKRNNISLVNA